MFASKLISGAFLSVAAALAASVSAPAVAQQPSEWEPTALEILQLPPYCQRRFSKELNSVPGPTITGCGNRFNHFCPGLVALNRAERTSASTRSRQSALKSAKNHLRYTRAHMPQTCSVAGDLSVAEMRIRMLEITLR